MELDPSEKAERVEFLRSAQFAETRFNFLNDHYGLRKGNLHLLLGTSGKGKSTLARAAMLDMAKHHRVMYLTAEEETREIKDKFHLMNADPEVVKNITHFRDTEMMTGINPGETDQFLMTLSLFMMEYDSEILFWDNLTTSPYYETLDPTRQSEFARKLRDFCAERGRPFFIVIHTKKGIKDQQTALITADDVRGSQQIAMVAQYMYSIQILELQTKGQSVSTVAFLKCLKARGFGRPGQYYLLNYDHEQQTYFGDVRKSFEQFNEFYQERVRLGGK